MALWYSCSVLGYERILARYFEIRMKEKTRKHRIKLFGKQIIRNKSILLTNVNVWNGRRTKYAVTFVLSWSYSWFWDDNLVYSLCQVSNRSICRCMGNYRFVDHDTWVWVPYDSHQLKISRLSTKGDAILLVTYYNKTFIPLAMDTRDTASEYHYTQDWIIYAGEPGEALFLFTLSLLKWTNKDFSLRIESRHN